MKKKGFTLIELLAVIIILAVLALILTPMIQELILNARKSAFERSIDGILAAAEYYQMDNPSDEAIIFTCNGTSCEDSDGHKLVFKGEVPISGTITVSETGIVADNLCNNSFCGSGSKEALFVNVGGGTSTSTVAVGTTWEFDRMVKDTPPLPGLRHRGLPVRGEHRLPRPRARPGPPAHLRRGAGHPRMGLLGRPHPRRACLASPARKPRRSLHRGRPSASPAQKTRQVSPESAAIRPLRGDDRRQRSAA